MKAEKLTWNVYYLNFNERKIELFNIFRHYSFCECVDKAVKKYKKEIKKEGLTKKQLEELLKDFKEHIRREMQYYFWSKYEWEIGITEPFSNSLVDDYTKGRKYPWEKIDVYDQVMMNWDVFFDYLYKNLVENSRKKFQV